MTGAGEIAGSETVGVSKSGRVFEEIAGGADCCEGCDSGSCKSSETGWGYKETFEVEVEQEVKMEVTVVELGLTKGRQ